MAACLLLLMLCAEPSPQHGLRVPDGFEVTEVADSTLANDIYSMTVDPRGRPVVSGRGYIRVLADEDGQGRYRRAIEFANTPKDGANGLLWEGSSLFVVGDGGLWRYRDENADGIADGPPELIRKLKTGGEHGAHDVKRGPDGWLYVLCGNMSGIDHTYATLPTSLIKQPTAGCVLRFSPDLKHSEIVADGFRNAYRMDFNRDGELFTYDSDNERCVSLPWYEGTRFYHVIPGGHHGWQSPQRGQFWRLPPYLPDVVAPVADLGRGSPTAVVCYRHGAFPEPYRGAFFVADWTFGKIWQLTLKQSGATYTATKQVFLESVGENGFAPTDMVVHPKTGDLFISIGGRGTRGAVYRVRPRKSRAVDPSEVAAMQPKPRTGKWHPDQAKQLLIAGPSEDVLAGMNDKLGRSAQDHPELLRTVRVIQLALGGITDPTKHGTIWEGYSARTPETARSLAKTVVVRLRARFPSGNHDIDREITRTLAMIEDDDPAIFEKILATLGIDPVADIHTLAVLARLRATRNESATLRVAETLLRLDQRLEAQRAHRDRNWPLRVAELHAELARKDSRLNEALLNHAEFGRPDHVLFTRAAGFDRERAAGRFLERAKRQAEFGWTPALVELVGSLPGARVVPTLRELWDRPELRDAILRVLARRPEAADRAKFLEGLRSPQLGTIRTCLEALEQLPGSRAETEVLEMILALRQLADGKEENVLRERLAKYLGRATGQGKLGADKNAWAEWFATTYPAQKARLLNADGVDLAAWNKRLGQLGWSGGDVERGQVVYQKASCAACHSGAQALGPDLRGVANRFSRDDLFTAILQPNRDVPNRYQTTLLATRDGKVHQGMIIYEAVDGLILQTGPATTIRLGGNQIESRRVSTTSLMPAGLLDKLSDRDIVDLYAYLRYLGNPPGK